MDLRLSFCHHLCCKKTSCHDKRALLRPAALHRKNKRGIETRNLFRGDTDKGRCGD